MIARTAAAVTLVLAALAGLSAPAVQAEGEPGLEAFGRGPVVTGTRPLLTILAETEGMPFSTDHTAAFYRRLLFQTSSAGGGSIAGPGSFVAEASGRRMFFTDAGIVGPVHNPDDPATPGDERMNLCAFGFVAGCSGTGRKVLANAILGAVKRGVDFASHDRNRDGVVTTDELTIVVIGAGPEGDASFGADASASGVRVAADPGPGRIPLYRWKNGWLGDTVDTTAWPGGPGDVNAENYTFVGVTGYLDAAANGRAQVSTWYSRSRGDYAPSITGRAPRVFAGKPDDWVLIRNEGYSVARDVPGTSLGIRYDLAATDSSPGGANGVPDPGCIPANGGVNVCVIAVGVGESVGAATLAHELIHNLGVPWEAYGPNCNSQRYTIMSCTIGRVRDERWTVGVDPYARLRLGWLEPRILSARETGCFTLAPSSQRSDVVPSAYLLYDPSRGTDEFFLLEYRLPIPGSYDGDPFRTGSVGLPDEGLAVWVVRKGADGVPVTVRLSGGREEAAVYLVPPSGIRGQPGSPNGLWDASDGPFRPRWLALAPVRPTIRVLSNRGATRTLRFALGATRPACAGPEPRRVSPATLVPGVLGGPCALAGRDAVCTVDTPLFRARRRAPAFLGAGAGSSVVWTIVPKRPLRGRVVIEMPSGRAIRPVNRRTTLRFEDRKPATVTVPLAIGSATGRVSFGAVLRYLPGPGERGLTTTLRAGAFVGTPGASAPATPPSTVQPTPPPPPPPPSGPLPKPDLAISQVTKTGFTVTNQGQVAAGAFSVTMSVGGQVFQTFAFPNGLAQGAATGGSFACRTGPLTATADSAKQVDESDEGNNSASTTNLKCP